MRRSAVRSIIVFGDIHKSIIFQEHSRSFNKVAHKGSGNDRQFFAVRVVIGCIAQLHSPCCKLVVVIRRAITSKRTIL